MLIGPDGEQIAPPTDGGGSTDSGDSSDSSDSTDTDTITFDPDDQTLGTGGLGTTTGEDNDTIDVGDSDSDPSDSSPAGGAGEQEAIERFAGLEEGALDGATTEEVIEVGQAASDYYTAEDRGNDAEAEAARQELQQAVQNAVGSTESGNGIGEKAKMAAAIVTLAAAIGLGGGST
ncbi:hypothetical protein [Halolamina sp. C58]|uniref:hypothetical protein n=1 Tax=Halolamina sp. C58 TaxID=3421640 RepID=UPI003EBCB316